MVAPTSCAKVVKQQSRNCNWKVEFSVIFGLLLICADGYLYLQLEVDFGWNNLYFNLKFAWLNAKAKKNNSKKFDVKKTNPKQNQNLELI